MLKILVTNKSTYIIHYEEYLREHYMKMIKSTDAFQINFVLIKYRSELLQICCTNLSRQLCGDAPIHRVGHYSLLKNVASHFKKKKKKAA